MPPAPHTSNGPLVAMPEGDSEPRLPSKEELKKREEAQLYEEFSGDIVWFNTIGFVLLHALCLVGCVRCAGTILFIHKVVQWKTIFWGQYFSMLFLWFFKTNFFFQHFSLVCSAPREF
jgi:hypothetical protein